MAAKKPSVLSRAGDSTSMSPSQGQAPPPRAVTVSAHSGGNGTIAAMQKHCTFRRITSAGLRESHVHDVSITKEAPNYKSEG